MRRAPAAVRLGHRGGSSQPVSSHLSGSLAAASRQLERQPDGARYENRHRALAYAGAARRPVPGASAPARTRKSQAVTVMPGGAFSGSMDGHLRAYSTIDGKILWDFDTAKEFQTKNGSRRAAALWITAARPS